MHRVLLFFLIPAYLILKHWVLTEGFRLGYPNTKANIDKILFNDGGIITAGEVMLWLDLELVAQCISPNVMRQRGELLLVDTRFIDQHCFRKSIPRWS